MVDSKKSYYVRLGNKQTARARRIYKAIFGERMPKGWQFVWFFLGATDAVCKQIMLIDGLYTKHDMNTLVHELVHVKHPKMPHGKHFEKLVRKLQKIAEQVK